MAENGTSKIAGALLAAQKEMPRLHKDAKADTGKFSYAYLSLDSLLAETLPVLNKHGLVLVQAPCVSNGKQALRTTILHESGEFCETEFPLAISDDAGAQAQGSAITYVRRYSLMAMLALSPDEDDDGKSASKPRQANHKPAATERGLEQGQKDRINELLESLEKALPSNLREEDWTTTASGWIKEQFQVDGSKDLNVAQGNRLIEELESWLLAESGAKA